MSSNQTKHKTVSSIPRPNKSKSNLEKKESKVTNKSCNKPQIKLILGEQKSKTVKFNDVIDIRVRNIEKFDERPSTELTEQDQTRRELNLELQLKENFVDLTKNENNEKDNHEKSITLINKAIEGYLNSKMDSEKKMEIVISKKSLSRIYLMLTQ